MWLRSGSVSLTLLHVPTAPAAGADGPVLTGTWPGQETPLLLAVIGRAS